MKILTWWRQKWQKRSLTLKNKDYGTCYRYGYRRALIVGFMVANDISERQSYEDVRKELGKKLLKKEKEKEKK